MTTSVLAASSVTAGNIAAGAITTPAISAGAVTANQLAANSVTANAIASNSITTAAIQAGAVQASQIAAGAITAGKLAIQAVGSALNRDPNFTDPTAWTVAINSSGLPPVLPFVMSAPGVSASTCVYVQNAAGGASGAVWMYENTLIPISAASTYLLSGNFYSDPGNGRSAYLALIFYDSNGNFVASNGWGGDWSGYPWAGTPASGQFAQVSGSFGAGTANAIPSNVTQCRVGVILNYGAGGSNLRMAAQGVMLQLVLPGTLIQNGAISTSKIAAGAVTAAQILANTITSTQIAANTITGGNIAAQTITGSNIAAGTVTASNITVSNLAALSSNLGAVTAGSLNIGGKFIVGSDGTTTIQSSTTGQRSVMSNGLFQVYDSNNTLRVQLGIW